MKTKINTIYTITAEDKKRYLRLTFEKKGCTDFNSNLPYDKSIDDWEFYGKAITRIINKYRKLICQ